MVASKNLRRKNYIWPRDLQGKTMRFRYFPIDVKFPVTVAVPAMRPFETRVLSPIFRKIVIQAANGIKKIMVIGILPSGHLGSFQARCSASSLFAQRGAFFNYTRFGGAF